MSGEWNRFLNLLAIWGNEKGKRGKGKGGVSDGGVRIGDSLGKGSVDSALNNCFNFHVKSVRFE